MSKILNSILLQAGNQCSLRMTGVIWSYFRVPLINLAAVLWTDVKLLRVQTGKP